MTTKEKVLNPVITPKNIDTDKQDNIFLKNQIEEANFNNSLMFSDDGEEQDTYFKNVVNQLMNNEHPSTKTEYLNVNENFTGVKIEFLGQYGNIPILNKFMNIFETKRISLQRKGRKELIMALVERQAEMQREQDIKLKNILMK